MRSKLLSKAASFRDKSGSTKLEDTINRIFEKLADGGFAALILGGFALQEYGYARYTDDVDVVVNDLEGARSYLGIRGFKPVAGNRFKLIDRENGVEVDMLQGGQSLSPNCLPLPMPTEVVSKPAFLTLHDLIENKIDSYLNNKNTRLKDVADVQELMKINKPGKDLLDNSRDDILDKYNELWDGLRQESLI
jgi:hypothetical protein